MKKRIMAVDDDENFCFFLKKNLENTGNFEVIVCNQSRNAVRMAKENRPDLILLDLMMPDKSGVDIAAELKVAKETKDIPLLFLTAILKEEELKKNKNLMSGNYISKPAKIDELVEAIEKAIAKSGSSANGKAKEKVRIVTFLSRNQIDFLDKIGKDALFQRGSKLSRSETLDELVTLLIELGIDIREVDLSRGLAQGILKALGK